MLANLVSSEDHSIEVVSSAQKYLLLRAELCVRACARVCESVFVCVCVCACVRRGSNKMHHGGGTIKIVLNEGGE